MAGGNAIELEQALASGAPADHLVPGDVAGLTLAADTLRGHAALLEVAAAALARVEVMNWQGRASDGFTEAIGAEPSRWRAAADGFVAGAVALEGFAASLGPARERAAEAVDLYERYRAAADAAAVLATVPTGTPATGAAAFGARIEQQQRAAKAGGPAAVMAADADALRRAAIDRLGSARSMAEAAGDIAVEALNQACAGAPEARRFWQTTIRPADIVGTGHAVLDGAGMIPGLGMIPDGVNATWYAVTGDTPNAAISAMGMLPIIGDSVMGGKLVIGGAGRITKSSNRFWLFRGMIADQDGLPLLAEDAKGLGVRPTRDLPLDDTGVVHPFSGGLSANVNVDSILDFRRSLAFGGTGKLLTMFAMRYEDMSPQLRYLLDRGKSHGTVQPMEAMPIDDYQDLLHQTRPWWGKVRP